jgi:hypothetical protein
LLSAPVATPDSINDGVKSLEIALRTYYFQRLSKTGRILAGHRLQPAPAEIQIEPRQLLILADFSEIAGTFSNVPRVSALSWLGIGTVRCRFDFDRQATA